MKKTAYIAMGAAAVAAIAFSFAGCGNKSTAGLPHSVATVNGTTITADQLANQAAIQFGQQVLTNMIEQQILMDWAKKEGVDVTDDQISKLTEMFKREGMYDDQVKMMGEEAIKNQLKVMQAQINLVGKLDKISDAEAKTTFDTPGVKRQYVHGPRKRLALIVNMDKKKVDDAAGKLSTGEDPDSVCTAIIGGPSSKVWVQDVEQEPLKIVADTAKSIKVGECSKVFPVAMTGSPTQYVVFKVLAEQPKDDKKFEDVKSEIIGFLSMQKFQSPSMQAKFNDQKKNADIKIDVVRLAGVANTIKNPPPAMGMAPGMSTPPPSAKRVKPGK